MRILSWSLELINEILDLSVIEAGKLTLSLESVSLTELMRECQAMIEPLSRKNAIPIHFLPFASSWFVHVDRTRLKQAIINLLSNAIKYNRTQGAVEVSCIESSPNHFRICVKDSGAGLSTEQMAQLFQPFNRLGQESSAKEGTGIGLVVTKQLVELMGGSIGVKSTVGVSSEFWIELLRDAPPVRDDRHSSAENIVSAKRSMTLRTLLYVEDNLANLMLLEQIIAVYPNVKMFSAHNAAEGIALARVHLPEVILMDINLPDISGIETLRILRKDPTTAHIPIVAISANAMPRDFELGMQAGFARYITKPIKVDELLNILNIELK